MSLRRLDNHNQGDSGAAISAISYAREMRERLTTNSANRVTEGASVKVLNNSWGHHGGYEAAIANTYDAGILFVAAACNGNTLNNGVENGVDNDRAPFYPASYDSPNVIAVSASDASDNLATFSNIRRGWSVLIAPEMIRDGCGIDGRCVI